MLFGLRVFFLLRLCVAFFVFADEPEPAFAAVLELADDEPVPSPGCEVTALEPALAAVFELAVLAEDEPAPLVAATVLLFEPDAATPLADEPLFDAEDPDAADPADPDDDPGAAEPRDEPDADEPAPEADDFAGAAASPSASIHAPAPASARSTSSTAMIKPTRRFGTGSGIDSSGFARRCCDVGCTLCAAAAGGAPLVCMRELGAGVGIGCAATCGLLGLRCTLGVSGYEAGGAFCGLGCAVGVRWPTRCAAGCTGWAPVSIFCVGARRFSAEARRAPQPPQNRESGSFSVPQLGQRIPP